MHYYQFNIGDYHSHTSHLDPIEDVAYRRMMDFCYLNEMPLPLDIDEIGRLIRMRTHNESIAYVLRTFFEKGKNGYFQKRIFAEIEKYKDKSEKAKKSAEARWASKDVGLADANALRSECESNAKHKPRTKNQEPRTKNHKTSTGVDYSPLNLAQDHIDEIIRIRKKNSKTTKAAAISQRIINTMVKEFNLAYEAGYTIDDILNCWDNTTWQTFKFEWMVNRIGKPSVDQQREKELQAWFNAPSQADQKITIDNDTGDFV